MHFLDEVQIEVIAGRGGSGAISFRREAHVPKGGPDGGNGGDGGNVILQVDANKNTLHHFVGKKIFQAKNGQGGSGKKCSGATGEDLVLAVPPGTLVKIDGQIIADLTEPGSSWIAARGGLGGKGNANFSTSTRQTPRFAELGEPGERHTLALELRLVADIGIIGLPSIGKSTLISVVSAARPKIAEYHFTTLVPNLGVVSHRETEFVVTDLPGLIAGAAAGRGLGHRFLKHAERVRFFWHLVAADSPTPVTDYRTVRSELKKFDPELAAKEELVVISRADLLEPKQLAKLNQSLAKASGAEVLEICAPIHSGLTTLLDRSLQQLSKLKQLAEDQATEAEPMPVFRPHLAERSKSYRIEKIRQGYRIDGPRLNQIVVMSDLSNVEALARVQDVLKKFGVSRELAKLGAAPGSRLEIAGKSLEWWGE